MREHNKSLCKTYTFIAISSTLLELYGITSSLHTFTWRFALILLFICLHVFNKNEQKPIKANYRLFLPFMILMTVGFFLNLIDNTGGFEMRWLRFMLLSYFALFLGQKYFDGEYGLKIYKYIVWIATAVLFIQVASVMFLGRPFAGHLPLPLRSPTYATSDFYMRHYSIFEEPGYYGIYVAPYLCIRLFQKKINFIEIFAISFALLLSTSSSNIGVFGFLIFTFILFVKPQHMKKSRVYLMKGLIIIIGVLAVYLLMQTSQYDFIMNRIESGHSADSRAEGYQNLDAYFHGSINKWLFGNSLSYYPISGFATLVICFGWVGALAYLIALLVLFARTNKMGKYIIASFLFVNIGNVEFLGNASSMLIVFPYAFWFARLKKRGVVAPLENI